MGKNDDLLKESCRIVILGRMFLKIQLGKAALTAHGNDFDREFFLQAAAEAFDDLGYVFKDEQEIYLQEIKAKMDKEGQQSG